MKHEFACFLLALQFLTRLPIRSESIYSADRMARSVRYYPLVGVIIGVLIAFVFYFTNLLVEHQIAVLLCVSVGLLLTGAFHEDGLADTFDGIGGGNTRETSLHIMRDSRLGTYGTLALIVALALKVSALSALSSILVIASLIAAQSLSRLSSVITIATSRYVRDEGTGKPVAGTISRMSLTSAFATGILVLLIWTIFLPIKPLFFAIVGLILGHALMRLFFERKLGGYTGDTLGAVQQSSEIGFYLGVCAWL